MKKSILVLSYSLLLLSTLFSCGKSGNYRQAVKNNDFEAAHEILDKMYDDFLDTYESNYDGVFGPDRPKIEKAAIKYAQAASYVLCAEARYLISEDKENALERIAYLFNEVRIMGEPATSYYPDGVDDLQQECIKYTCYNQTSIYNNQLCDVVLNLAIQNNNKQLAELALSYYRPNGVIMEGIITGEGKVRWMYKDKEVALEKYNKHFDELDNSVK